LLWIVWSRFYERRAIADAVNLIGWERELTEHLKVEPLIGGILETTVVEIEGVDVEVGNHAKKTGPPPWERPRYLAP
jgi:hypothetical protein